MGCSRRTSAAPLSPAVPLCKLVLPGPCVLASCSSFVVSVCVCVPLCARRCCMPPVRSRINSFPPNSQAPVPATSPSPSPATSPTPSTPPSLTTSSERSRERDRGPVSQPPREREPRLDENLDFFDFNALLSTTTVKPPKTHESLKMPTQSVGPWGIAPPRPIPTATTTTVRSWIVEPWGWTNSEPRVLVNRPMTTHRSRHQPNPRDQSLIHLVNDRLRQQGMQIEPAREVPVPTPAPSPVPATVSNPFEPFRFRGQDRQEPQPWREPSNDLDAEEDSFTSPRPDLSPRPSPRPSPTPSPPNPRLVRA